MFGLKKKKKLSALDLPPPPAPPSIERPKGDLPPIKPSAGPPGELTELPELPPFESQEPTKPELEVPEPSPELEFPAPPLPETPIPGTTFDVEPVSTIPRTLPELQPIEEPSIEQREPRVRQAPGKAFVSVDEYQRILEHSNRVRAKLSEADDIMKRLDDIRGEEEKTFDRWRTQLEDVERKLSHVDRVMEKAKR